MSAPASPAAPDARSRLQDLLLALAVLGFTAIVFWPPVHWLASQTFAHEQLKQSAILVVLAGLWIAFEKRRTLSLRLEFSNAVIAWFLAAYALAGGALLLKTPLLILAGLIAAAGGAVNYLFGAQAFRRTLPLLSVFAVLILCVLLFPVLDWPLRQMAGVESARFLKSIGLASQLAIQQTPDIRLLLITPQQTFLVATECNGFGLITSSLLLGLIRLLYRQAAWAWFVLLLPLCVLVAFVFNFLRIAAIVLLAPRFPAHYDVLHEIAGLIALYSGLGVVWLLTGWHRLSRPAA
ncbi:exosortase [Nibricoccus aquaticus]|uniref:Exosortase n=1 Tax=Nibricoccus aquaticus TaxID=2576891 RepID=A0A290Q2Q3_9BACT|nr:archaeosortase/exosortase family protein [Nibricoccus aquaticus]ATC62945.1 exosortase [Nibricoccus aquaticus]